MAEVQQDKAMNPATDSGEVSLGFSAGCNSLSGSHGDRIGELSITAFLGNGTDTLVSSALDLAARRHLHALIAEDTERLLSEGASPDFVLKTLCQTTGLTAETIQEILEAQLANAAPFEGETHPTTLFAEAIARAAGAGVTVSELPSLFPESADTLLKAAVQVEFDRLSAFVSTVFCEDYFADDSRTAEIIAPKPDRETVSRPRKAPAGLPPVLADLYRTPLLDFKQEQHLFRRYNFYKYQIAEELALLDRESMTSSDLESCRWLLKEADKTREEIAHANLRLVVNNAKHKKGQIEDGRFFERISDGNAGLLLAIDKFDYTKTSPKAANGRIKFATYATFAIKSSITRDFKNEMKVKTRFRTEGITHDEEFGSLLDSKADDSDALAEEAEKTAADFNSLENALFFLLDDREQKIVKMRFGLTDAGSTAQTLERTGKSVGVTKERIRQLESRALLKMRVAVAAGRLPIELSEDGRPYFDRTAPSLERFNPAVVEAAWIITNKLQRGKRSFSVGELKVEFDPALEEVVEEAVTALHERGILRSKGHSFVFNKESAKGPPGRSRRKRK